MSAYKERSVVEIAYDKSALYAGAVGVWKRGAPGTPPVQVNLGWKVGDPKPTLAMVGGVATLALWLGGQDYGDGTARIENFVVGGSLYKKLHALIGKPIFLSCQRAYVAGHSDELFILAHAWVKGFSDGKFQLSDYSGSPLLASNGAWYSAVQVKSTRNVGGSGYVETSATKIPFVMGPAVNYNVKMARQGAPSPLISGLGLGIQSITVPGDGTPKQNSVLGPKGILEDDVSAGVLLGKTAPSTTAINRDTYFMARISGSYVQYEVRDGAGGVVRNAVHELTCTAFDREKAGLSDTPNNLQAPIARDLFEIPRGSGAFYNLWSIQETDSNEIVLGFESNTT